MTRWILAAGAAALAITAPVAAQKGDKGGGKEHSQHAKASKGGGDQKADRGNRGGGQKFVQRDDKQSRGGGKSEAKQDRGNDRAMKADRGNRGNDKVRDVRVDRSRDRDDDVRIVRVDRDDDDFRFVPRWNDRGLVRGFVDGCPPGLAKKNNGCMPPGLAKKLVGTPLSASLMGNMLDGPYRSWYRDNDDFMYRWDDDYIYRVRRDGGLIDALFPYQNRDYYYYPVGMSYPLDYNYYNVPYQYQSFYPDGGDSWYRYGDGAIYQVNPSTGLIQGIAALLTGNPLSVGQPLPMGYSTYNVPFGYRDRYYDTADNMYRYNDGYIYRVDPTTQLITAVINALV